MHNQSSDSGTVCAGDGPAAARAVPPGAAGQMPAHHQGALLALWQHAQQQLKLIAHLGCRAVVQVFPRHVGQLAPLLCERSK
jgi:hypothetical protein